MGVVDLNIEEPVELLAYLRRNGHIGAQEQLDMRVLAGGVSNRTVLVQRSQGASWVLKQALEKLRVPFDWHSDPRRIHREALGLRWLAQLAPSGAITPLVFEDFEQHLMAMLAVPQPHENWKTQLMAGRLEMDRVRQFGQLLGIVHRQGHQHGQELREVFADRSYFDSLRIEPYYRFSARQMPETSGFLDRLIADTYEQRTTLVHGDYSPKNILVYCDQLVLLDHEVIHFGDGAFDIGFALAHLLSKAHHQQALRAAFGQAARVYWEAYGQAIGPPGWGPAFEERSVRHTLGCLLARVAGRSRLEYLDEAERKRQGQAVLALMRRPPMDMLDLITRFLKELENLCQ